MAINVQEIWSSYDEFRFDAEDFVRQVEEARQKDISNFRARMRMAGYEENSKAIEEGILKYNRKYDEMLQQSTGLSSDSDIYKFLSGEAFEYNDKKRSLDYWRREISEGLSDKKEAYLRAIRKIPFVDKYGRPVKHYLTYYTDYYRKHINDFAEQRDREYSGGNYRPFVKKARTPLTVEQYYAVMFGEKAGSPKVIQAEADRLAAERAAKAKAQTPTGDAGAIIGTVPIEVTPEAEEERETWWN